MCRAFDYLFWKWPILNNLVPVFPPKGVTSNADESNYDRDGNTYKDLVSLLSARSKKFQDMINSKEFALHEEKKTEQLNAYEENGDDDELDRPAEKEKGKEEKEEKASKEKVRGQTLWMFDSTIFSWILVNTFANAVRQPFDSIKIMFLLFSEDQIANLQKKRHRNMANFKTITELSQNADVNLFHCYRARRLRRKPPLLRRCSPHWTGRMKRIKQRQRKLTNQRRKCPDRLGESNKK